MSVFDWYRPIDWRDACLLLLDEAECLTALPNDRQWYVVEVVHDCQQHLWDAIDCLIPDEAGADADDEMDWVAWCRTDTYMAIAGVRPRRMIQLALL